MDERGFTLVEMLVVTLIIGVLAAIALPAFTGQSEKARDAAAKSDVRNAVTQMESCAEEGSYAGCPSDSFPLPADVAATVSGDGSGYVLRRTSDSDTVFSLARLAGSVERSCTVPDAGGCDAVGHW